MVGRSTSNESSGRLSDELIWADRISRLLDSKFRIPGTKITFGVDPVIGMVPYFGEIVTFSISGLLVLSMARNGASGKVVAQMIFNVVADMVTGFVPVFGDMFDVWFKANRRNYRLLKEHQTEGKHGGSAWPMVIGVTVILLLLLAALIWGMIAMTSWIMGLL